jgi:DNA-binding LytR/AlgR family response regulator
MAETTSALIVEDEPLLRAALREHLAALWPDLEVREAADGLEAARSVAEAAPSIVFLDIQVPALNGFEIARLVSGRSHVVFVTAFQEHALAAFEEGAVDFVVKPIERERLAVTVARLRQRMPAPPADIESLLRSLGSAATPKKIRWIQASAGNRIQVIPIEEVHYFQAESKYTKVATTRGEVHIRKSLKDLLDDLDPESFWQVHRGTIVNAARIDSVTRDGDTMSLKLVGRTETLPVSQPYQSRFRRL